MEDPDTGGSTSVDASTVSSSEMDTTSGTPTDADSGESGSEGEESDGSSDDSSSTAGDDSVLLIASDWSAGDWSDGGKWGNQSIWAETRATVIPAEAGEPWAQKLQINVGTEPGDSWIQMTLDGGPSPGIGQPVTVRWYERLFEHSASDPGHHPIALGPTNGGQPWYTVNTVPGGYVPGLQIVDDFDQPYEPVEPIALGVWYRFEWTTVQETETTSTSLLHVYDMDGELVLTPEDFIDARWGDGQTSLAERVFEYDFRPWHTQFTGFLDGADGSNVLWGEFAAVAMVIGNTVGPYNPDRGY